MNKPIRKVAVAIAVLFLALFVNLNFVQVFQGSKYRDDSQNKRVLLNEYASPRGAIVVGGLTFMFGEMGAKRQLAGIVFGGGLALFAAQFLVWLF